MAYPFTDIEAKWQAYWRAKGTFRTPATVDTTRPKYYVLDMFPYPSGDGLHVGHPEGYTATDIVARYKRMQRLQRAAPDGLGRVRPAGRAVRPEDRHAPEDHDGEKRRTLPRAAPEARLLVRLGRARSTRPIPRTTSGRSGSSSSCSSAGSRIKRSSRSGGARSSAPRSRTRKSSTASREVGGFPCVRRPLRQWVLKITEYADQLLEDLDALDWPESTKEMQRNWIGRSEGAEIEFLVAAAPSRPRGHRRARAASCSRRAPTRCSARPTWSSRPSTSSSTG